MNQQALSPQTSLQGGRYTILRTLGQGGFGITYLAMQRGLEREVVVKEFFMKSFCDRVRARKSPSAQREVAKK